MILDTRLVPPEGHYAWVYLLYLPTMKEISFFRCSARRQKQKISISIKIRNIHNEFTKNLLSYPPGLKHFGKNLPVLVCDFTKSESHRECVFWEITELLRPILIQINSDI